MSKKRILFVDDEESLLRLIKLNVEAGGEYEVSTRNRGSEALQAARDFKPDMIFMDIIMPDMKGTQAVELIREDPALKHVPIVYMTATISAKNIGADRVIDGEIFLAKPASLSAILSTIKSFVG